MQCLLLILCIIRMIVTSKIPDDERVKGLVRDWAPLVWLAPGERFLPLGVPEFLDNMQSNDDYLRTRVDVEILLGNRSSFLYGRKPAGAVPVYAVIKNCAFSDASTNTINLKNTRDERKSRRKGDEMLIGSRNAVQIDDLMSSMILTNDLPGNIWNGDAKESVEKPGDFEKTKKKGNRSRKLHFHVTYWMFYPFSEGKAVCVLDLGFFGSWPIPTVGGICLGMLKEYGNHVGDWEHMSLYFKDASYPSAMYVSAHDAGAFYRYDLRSGIFIYESQETRNGIFQKPIFPERVFTAGGSHPILFSARGSHGLWTAPGKHKFVRLPRLYDESGFGIAWPTWKKMELLLKEDNNILPSWMTFRGKWGNPKSNCHPLARLGFNICEFVDGPTGIPMKQSSFRC
ncbi:Vacuolar protein sorting-associated protein 62 [Anthophora plagiata]